MIRWLALVPLAGCATLDAFVFNPIHCTAISEDTCTAYDNPWDNGCVPCEEPYDWQQDHPFDYFPDMLAPGESVRPIPDEAVTRLTLATDDGEGELDAYFIAAHGDDPGAAAVTIAYNHGNFLGIEHYRPRVRVLYEAGYNVLIWDYRGYGKSLPDTVPTPDQHLADARQVLDEVLGLAPDPERVVSYGYSIGSLSATEMAVQGETCALVLEAPFTSLARVQRATTTLSLGGGFFSNGEWDNYARMARYDGPALGMWGLDDEKWPEEDLRDLLATGAGSRDVWELPGVMHGVTNGGVVEAGLDAYHDHLRSFLAEAGCRGP